MTSGEVGGLGYDRDMTRSDLPPWKAQFRDGRRLKGLVVIRRGVLATALGLLVLILLWTAFYTVPAESEAVVLRFGRFIATEPSGLHFKLPLGIDEVYLVPVRRQLKLEFGFATEGATNPEQHVGRQE